ncbi:MAG: aminoglycoside phosphotransferase family protein [Microthrixaceae bacterium]
MSAGPPAEIDIDSSLVRGLVAGQCPDLATSPLRFVANGWDNTLVRAGEHALLRLPRRSVAAELLRNEATWLPRIAADLPIPVPVPIHLGHSTGDYPFPWTVVPWFEGEVLSATALEHPGRVATALGSFVGALHVDAPADAPHNPYRGVPLVQRDAVTRSRLLGAHGLLQAARIDPDEVRQAWDDALGAEPHQGPAHWVHGDLHPHNIVARHGEIVAVIDFGDITAGDPATDLLAAWYLFEQAERDAFRSAVGIAGGSIDDAQWARGKGWGIIHALAVIDGETPGSPLAQLAIGALARMIGSSGD